MLYRLPVALPICQLTGAVQQWWAARSPSVRLFSGAAGPAAGAQLGAVPRSSRAAAALAGDREHHTALTQVFCKLG